VASPTHTRGGRREHVGWISAQYEMRMNLQLRLGTRRWRKLDADVYADFLHLVADRVVEPWYMRLGLDVPILSGRQPASARVTLTESSSRSRATMLRNSDEVGRAGSCSWLRTAVRTVPRMLTSQRAAVARWTR
jgi:hypothetical protein